jgi:hypothetical protein
MSIQRLSARTLARPAPAAPSTPAAPVAEQAAAPVAAPAPAPATDVAAAPVAAKKAASKKAAAPAPAPAAAEEAAAPAAAPAKRVSKKAAVAAAAAAVVAAGLTNLSSSIRLPAPGSRIGNTAVRGELFLRYLEGQNAQLEKIRTEGTGVEYADALLRTTFEFLLGNGNGTPEATIESIVANGGLAQFFDVGVMPGVLLKVEEINRVYPNPRHDPSNPASAGSMSVTGRRIVTMRAEVVKGTTTAGDVVNDVFVPKA